MVEVAQGRVGDRPFARTVYTISAQRFTGDLVLRDGERRFKTSWEDGRVVAAESAAPADSAARVALAAGLVTSTHVTAALEVMARAPSSDPLQVLSELARLKPDQVVTLKRRLLAQRASRAFALPDASYVLDNARSLRADPDVPPIDTRWLVYFGLRTHYTMERLERELGPLLDRGLRLADDGLSGLPAFSFGERERAVTDRLAIRVWTPRQLLEACAGVEAQVVLSIVYALVACDCLEPGPIVTATPPPPTSATGSDTRAPAVTDAASADGSSAPRRPRTSLSTAPAPAVPGAAEHARLAHGTVRRLLFPGQGTSPPPTGDGLARRARRVSTRPPPSASGTGATNTTNTSNTAATPAAAATTKPANTTAPTSTGPTTSDPTAAPPSTMGRPTAEPAAPSGPATNWPAPRPMPTGGIMPDQGPAGSSPGLRSRRPTPEMTSAQRPTPEPAQRPTPEPAQRPTPEPAQRPASEATGARHSRPHSTTSPPILRRSGTVTIPPDANGPAAIEVRRMIDDRVRALERGVDHYAMLGVSHLAKPEEIRTAYFSIAKRIHPDRLRAVGVTDVDAEAQRLFARINQAFGVLIDPQRRAEYAAMISAGGEAAVRKAQADAEERAGRVLRAEETFRRGEMALRRSLFEQARALFDEAVSLNGEEAEYHALLAWTTWLAAPNKNRIAQDVQKRLAQALALSPRCVPAHFYCGQVAKQSGQTQAAIDAFQMVLQIDPTHTEANLELRVLRGRLKKK